MPSASWRRNTRRCSAVRRWRRATLIVEHLSAGKAVTSTAALQKLHAGFRRLTDSFLARDDVSPGERQAIMDHADELWQRAIRLFTAS